MNEMEPTKEMVEAACIGQYGPAWTKYAGGWKGAARQTVRRTLSAARAVDPLPAELLRLRGENERLRGALTRFEWRPSRVDPNTHAMGEPFCPACASDQLDGHRPSCFIAAALSSEAQKEGEA